MPKQKKKKEKEQEMIEVHIEWFVPDDVRTSYSNQLRVGHSEHEFYINFFELPPPSSVITDPSQIKYIKEKGIRATCVAQIVVHPSRMESFVKALSDNLEKYKTKVKVSKSEES